MKDEGILFSDIFINNRELFVDFFKSFYIERKAQLDPYILQLDFVLKQYKTKMLTKAMADAFKIAWGNFTRYVLLNTGDLELLVAYRGQGGRDATFSQIIKQSQVEGENHTGVGASYGIKAGDDLIKDSMKALEASKVEKYLQLHLNGFLRQLDTSVDNNEAYLLHRYHTDCLIQYYQDHDEAHLTGEPFRRLFYGSNDSHFFSGYGLGQAYDAYMNHMANKETAIYNYLTTSGHAQLKYEKFNINKDSPSIYVEENKIGEQGHFPQLLKESRNHTGWYTGGDIIIINPETLQIVYNIQLKTTTLNKGTVFAERVEKIRKFIQKFVIASPEEKGNLIFDFFLTSVSNKDAFNIIPQKEIDGMIKQTLLKSGIDIQWVDI